jgi:hypothetical protein
MTVSGVDFVEVAPGYCHVVRNVWKAEGDALGRIAGRLGLNLGNPPVRSHMSVDQWIEVSSSYWIARTPVHPTWRGDLTSDEIDEILQGRRGGEDTRIYMKRWLSAKNRRLERDCLRLPTKDELLFASDTGAFGEKGWELAGGSRLALLGPEAYCILVGPEWRGFNGSATDAVVLVSEKQREISRNEHRRAQESQDIRVSLAAPASITGRSFRPVWTPPVGFDTHSQSD